MQPTKERGVLPGEHGERGLPDWESARLFLQIVRHGSLRGAAEAQGLSVNTLRRRLEEFELELGFPLVTRHVDGVRLTPEGERVYATAERMEAVAFELLRERDKVDQSVSGEVRLSVTEGLGTFWIAPRLVEFQQAYPQLTVEMSCSMLAPDVLRLEADVAVQLTRPIAKDLRVTKLGRLHIMPFASADYIATYGMPKTIDDLVHHHIVLQVASQVDSEDYYAKLFPGRARAGHVAMRTNTSSAHLWSIAKGAGIGMLPTYAHAIAANLVPIDVGFHTEYDIWLTFHPDARRIARVGRLIDWLVDAFSPRACPWFRDDFIHPSELPVSLEGSARGNLFAGFDGPGAKR
jgi:DNA-binding transcriptional LysR family regulator